MVATLGVAAVGAVQAIFVAVMLALLRFVRLISRPKVEILGSVPGLPGLHSSDRHPNATTVPGLLLFRFNAPIVFFNASFFKRSALEAAEAAGPELKWFVVDMIPVTMIDITGLQAAAGVIETLRDRGVTFIAAGRETEWRQWAESRQLNVDVADDELARRAAEWRQPEPRYATGVFAKYAAAVGSASEGATT